MDSQWSLSDNNAVVWIVSTRLFISKSASPCTNLLVSVPSAAITVGITVTLMFHRFSVVIIIIIIIIIIVLVLTIVGYYTISNWLLIHGIKWQLVLTTIEILCMILTVLRKGCWCSHGYGKNYFSLFLFAWFF